MTKRSENNVEIIRVNAKGIEYIMSIMAEYQKPRADGGSFEKGAGIYAAEAEDNFANGNDPIFEISSSHSLDGRPHTFSLSEDDHYDVGYIDEDGYQRFAVKEE